MKRVRYFGVAVAITFALGVGTVAGMSIPQHKTYRAPITITGCPTEDSCKIDYRHGVWQITPDTP